MSRTRTAACWIAVLIGVSAIAALTCLDYFIQS
jgi:hypothetical protein